MIDVLGPSSSWTREVLALGLDVALKAAALGLLAFVLHALLGRRRPLVRSVLWNACLAGLLLLPASAAVFPRLSIACLPVPPDVASQGPIAAPGGDIAIAQSDVEAPAPVVSGPRTQSPVPRSGLGGAIVAVYFGVAGCLFLRLLVALAAVERLRRSSVAVAAPGWVEALERWRGRLGLRRPVLLARSGRADVPMVVGWLRPLIVLPETLVGAADSKTIDAVILHELAHVRRGDYAWNLVLRLVQVLYWPHPVAWLLGRVIGGVREQACDELCIYWMGDARDYRATLLDVASGLVRRRPWQALGLAMARSSRLGRRIAQIDGSQGRPRCLLRWPARVLIVLVTIAACGLLGSVQLARRAAAAQAPAPASKPGVVAANPLPIVQILAPARPAFDPLVVPDGPLAVRVRAATDEAAAGRGLIRAVRVLVDGGKAEEILVAPPGRGRPSGRAPTSTRGRHTISVTAVNDRDQERTTHFDVIAQDPPRCRPASDEPKKADDAAPKPKADEPKADPTKPPPISPEKEETAPLPRVRTVHPKRMDFAIETTQPCSLQAFEPVSIYARMAGVVRATSLARVGDRVAAGQVLAELNPTEGPAEIEKAAALLAQAQARERQAEAAVKVAQAALEGNKAKYREAQIAFSKAQRTLSYHEQTLMKQAERLRQDKVISEGEVEGVKQKLEDAKSALESADTGIVSARAAFDQGEAELNRTNAARAAEKINVRLAQAEVDRVQNAANSSKIASPIDGVVMKRNVEADALVRPDRAEPMFVIARTDKLTAITFVPESDVPMIDPGDTARVLAGGSSLEGKVTRTAYEIDPASRMLRVEIDLPNPNGKLRPGMSGQVTIVLETHPNALVIPATTFDQSIGRYECFRVVNGRTVTTPIKSRSLQLQFGVSEVLDGLDEAGRGDLLRGSRAADA